MSCPHRDTVSCSACEIAHLERCNDELRIAETELTREIKRLRETLHDCAVLAEMAYWGNCDDRQALRMIRQKLGVIAEQRESAETNG